MTRRQVDDPMVWARFLELDASPATTKEIAADLGVTTRTVERWRERADRKRPVIQAHPAADRERAAALIADGAPIAEAARTVGVAWRTVAEWFPDAPRWSKSQAGELSRAIRKAMAA